MASIFSDAMSFMRAAFKGAVSTDFLRDYKHASELFVGNDFSLIPKSGYLFHVFFDLNPYAANPILLDSTRSAEIGMMVKDVELPKFSIDYKSYNAYNRPNIVQSKIKYDQVNITFRDDSVNLIRNFWFDYYSYYYADTLNPIEVHRQDYKYVPNSPYDFGFKLRSDIPDYKYLQAIRIYSLTHNQFSEYLLVNPIITNFRHPKHDYEGQESAAMTHDMSVNYEGVFYNQGYVDSGEVKGFATLHYDRIRSPLNRIGSRRTIFGAGGLINTASSIITDIGRGNYLSAIFKFATARNSFKGVNIKKAALNEIRQSFTVSATNAITGLITQSMRSSNNNGYNIVSSRTLPNASTGPSINDVGSVLALTGAAVLLNSRTTSNKYQQTPTTQATKSQVNNNYDPRFPTVPGTAIPASAPSSLLKANDNTILLKDTNQRLIDIQQQRTNINQNITTLDKQLRSLSQTAANEQKQIASLTVVISNLNNKLAIARNAGTSQDIIDGILQQISVAIADKQASEARLTSLRTEITQTQSKINSAIIERNAING